MYVDIVYIYKFNDLQTIGGPMLLQPTVWIGSPAYNTYKGKKVFYGMKPRVSVARAKFSDKSSVPTSLP
jgi:hypothetical protein